MSGFGNGFVCCSDTVMLNHTIRTLIIGINIFISYHRFAQCGWLSLFLWRTCISSLNLSNSFLLAPSKPPRLLNVPVGILRKAQLVQAELTDRE